MRVLVAAGLTVLVTACSGSDHRTEFDAQTRAMMWDVQAAMEEQQYLQALAVIDSALQRTPQHAELHNLEGDVLTDLYRFDDAEAAYRRARELDPDARGIAFAMGNNAFFVSRYRDALAFYDEERQVVSRRDTTALGAIWAQIGRVYDRLGVPDSAIAAYETALGHRPSYGQTWAWLAELYEDEGALEDALAAAERAVRIDGADPEFSYLLARLNYQLGHLSAVEPYLQVTLAAVPWHVGAHYNMARYLLAQDRQEEASHYLRETDRLQVLNADIVLARFAAQNNPTGIEEWLVLAELYGQAGRRQERVEALRIASQLNQRLTINTPSK